MNPRYCTDIIALAPSSVIAAARADLDRMGGLGGQSGFSFVPEDVVRARGSVERLLTMTLRRLRGADGGRPNIKTSQDRALFREDVIEAALALLQERGR